MRVDPDHYDVGGVYIVREIAIHIYEENREQLIRRHAWRELQEPTGSDAVKIVYS